jgi:poly-gamma-glutamate capsule biosynthesis protein CapA/YwtB (metallophosphatase superfamily)
MKKGKEKNKDINKNTVYLFGIIIICVFAIYLAKNNTSLLENKKAKITFIGDIFFDRQIRFISYNKGEDHLFSCINSFLKEKDLIVGNLEGPITDNPSISIGTEVGSPNNFIFTFPPSSAKLLFENNIKLVDLGNNHINNFGREGIKSTEKYLNKAGINYFGGISGDENIYRTKVNGLDLSFISYNQFGGSNAKKVAEKIKSEKEKGNKVIVFSHWGEEYVDTPEYVKQNANIFVEAGADLIVGSHPHVIQGSEIIKNVPVYYSLGNFMFDQYWDKNVSTGLILETEITSKNIKVTEQRVKLNRDGTTCLE